MTRRRPRGNFVIPALAVAFSIGIIVGWWLRSGAPVPATVPTPETVTSASPPSQPGRSVEPGGISSDDPNAGRASLPVATTGEPLIGPGPPAVSSVIADLRARELRVPIDGATVESMKGGFAARRDKGARPHEAVDLLAPRGTPVHAVEDGTIAKLFFSKAGGITIYQFDPSQRFCYYYAHLDRYASGLKERQAIARGDVVGYVGSTGNAAPNAPHLHFAVFELDQDRRWWKGRAIDPYLLFTQ